MDSPVFVVTLGDVVGLVIAALFILGCAVVALVELAKSRGRNRHAKP